MQLIEAHLEQELLCNEKIDCKVDQTSEQFKHDAALRYHVRDAYDAIS